MKKTRKKWTPKLNETVNLEIEREKKKWQLNFRRYVIEKKPSIQYAPYFGLDIENIRKWYSLYFNDEIQWNNFGKNWKFSHLIPINFFDFKNTTDMKICWSFLNIRIEKLSAKTNKEVELLNVGNYFKELYFLTKLPILVKFLEKINNFLNNKIEINDKFVQFIKDNKILLNDINDFNEIEYYKLNSQQISFNNLMQERELIKKYMQ
ncbi:MAG: hypothetical protein QM539_07690 [Alphaproteobacteria bacterium]|nr:hypothetical protein [Alphaproteobacteria bacterium]